MDALNGIIILDSQMRAALAPLAPKHGVYDTRRPRAISGHVGIPPPTISIMANYIHKGR